MSRSRGDVGRWGHAGRKRFYPRMRGYCSGCPHCDWYPKRLQSSGRRDARREVREVAS